MAKKKNKNSNFDEYENPQFVSYKKGAILGGLFGGVTGLLAGKNIIIFTLIGAAAGGYISYKIFKDDYKETLKESIKNE